MITTLRNAGRRHSPHGECGLKFAEDWELLGEEMSLPAWGVWIEIASSVLLKLPILVTPRMGSVD